MDVNVKLNVIFFLPELARMYAITHALFLFFKVVVCCIKTTCEVILLLQSRLSYYLLFFWKCTGSDVSNCSG